MLIKLILFAIVILEGGLRIIWKSKPNWQLTR